MIEDQPPCFCNINNINNTVISLPVLLDLIPLLPTAQCIAMNEYLILMLRRWVVARRTRRSPPASSSTVVALVTTAFRSQKVLTLHLALREQSSF